jgi:hypothetical protein
LRNSLEKFTGGHIVGKASRSMVVTWGISFLDIKRIWQDKLFVTLL